MKTSIVLEKLSPANDVARVLDVFRDIGGVKDIGGIFWQNWGSLRGEGG